MAERRLFDDGELADSVGLEPHGERHLTEKLQTDNLQLRNETHNHQTDFRV
jgi:hypothetical protein